MLPTLPIDTHLGVIAQDVSQTGGFVLVAEPGAGKTTRVPPSLLPLVSGEIWISQPRRLAARMAARRVAEELATRLGDLVGYAVRFDRASSDATRIYFVTEGVLRRRLTEDPSLGGVGAVILDEFHERTLDGDLNLALLRQLKVKRPELVVAVMSATLDAERVESFLSVPIRRVPGRSHPIAVEYSPDTDDRPLERRVRAALHRLRDTEGDILVFLPGAREIRRTAEAVAERARDLEFDVVVLHGEMSAADQERAIRAGPKRKVILSTNVAETSLTIEGVRAVVDSGLVRRVRHSPWTGRRHVETARTSQASCVQRAGRAGRLGPGHCVRLYPESDLRTRPPFDPPEIATSDLSALALMLWHQGHDPRSFAYFEAPPDSHLAEAERVLSWIGAVNSDRLTADGRQMAELPCHPRHAAVVLEGGRRGVGRSACEVAAVLEVGELRRMRPGLRPTESLTEVGRSDVLERWTDYRDAKSSRFDSAALRRLELDPRRVREVDQTRRQIERAASVGGAAAELTEEDTEEALLLSILKGFGDRVMQRRAPGTADMVFAWGGSATLARESVVKEATWAVAVEADEKSGGTLVRVASEVEADWMLELFESHIEDVDELRFDPKVEAVERVRAIQFGALTLDESRARAFGAEAETVLGEVAVQLGFSRFVDAEAFESLRRRLVFAAAHGQAGGFDESLLATVLREAVTGASSLDDIRGSQPLELLRARLDMRALDRIAPSRVVLPGLPHGVRVHYEVDRPPWIEARIQDFFGASSGPAVAGGKVPLVLHLLAPNDRAVQVTTDLQRFWREHYPSQRKELSRRYPRHHFPEDPFAARPVRLKSRL